MTMRDKIEEEMKKVAEERKALDAEMEELRIEFLKQKGLKFDEDKKQKDNFHGWCEHPGTMENGTATFFWIVAMIVGALFNDRLIIWIVATFLWLRFIMRHTT